MIPKLQVIHNKIVHKLAIQNTDSTDQSNKRSFEDVDIKHDPEDVKTGELGYKKVKRSLDCKTNTEDVNSNKSPFFVKFFCDTEIHNYIPQENLLKFPEPTEPSGETHLTFRREDFTELPAEVVLRLSKEHADIKAWRENDKLAYELTDYSVNGTYLLGNSIQREVENPPRKLINKQKYRIKHGDRVALLMKKFKHPPQPLLGFEFLENTNF